MSGAQNTGAGQCVPDLPELGGGQGEAPAPSQPLGSGAGAMQTSLLCGWYSVALPGHTHPLLSCPEKESGWMILLKDITDITAVKPGTGMEWHPDFWAVCLHLSL